MALVLSVPWLMGCGDSNGGDAADPDPSAAQPRTAEAPRGAQAASAPASAGQEVSSDELIQVLGGEVFTLGVPAGTDPGAVAGLALRYGGEDGRIDPIGGVTGYAGGEALRVVLLRQPGGVMRFGILGSDGLRDGMEARLPDFPAATVNPQRQGLADGAWLVRFGLIDEPDSSAVEAGEGEADLIFHIQQDTGDAG